MIASSPRIFGAAGVAVLLAVASVLAPTAGAAVTAPASGALHQYGWWYGVDTAYGGYGYYGLPPAFFDAGAPASSATQQYTRFGYNVPYYGYGVFGQYVPYYGYGSLGGDYPSSSTAAWLYFHDPPYLYLHAGTYTSPYLGSPTYYPRGASYAPGFGPITGPSIDRSSPAGAGGGSPQQGR